MNGSTPPGSPPLPPSTLQNHPLPLHTLEPGSLLQRIHHTQNNPLHFNRSTDPNRRQRWDDPDGLYGVCYLAEHGHTCFSETMLRDLDIDAVAQDDLNTRSLALIGVLRPLRLVEMNGEHLRRIGADASTVHASYDVTWTWSTALHNHPDQADGIRYRARHDDSGIAIALFDRARDRVETKQSQILADPSMATIVGAWLDRYGVKLIPPT